MKKVTTIPPQSQKVDDHDNHVLGHGRVPRACRSLDHLVLASYSINTSLLQDPKVAHLALVRVDQIDYHKTTGFDIGQSHSTSTQVAITVSPTKGVVIQ